MTNIEMAIRKEQEYLDYRKDRGESLLSLLSEYGYDDLAQYFKDKCEFQVRSVNYELHDDLDETDIDKKVESAVRNRTPSIWIPTPSKPMIWHGSDELDEEVCAELGYAIYDMSYNGGNIVTGEEDFSFLVIVPNKIDISTGYFMSRFEAFFKRYFDDVECNANDILINQKKILGSMQREVNNLFIFACQVSFKDRSDMINAICPPTGDKIPGCIDTSVLTKSELKREVISWLL